MIKYIKRYFQRRKMQQTLKQSPLFNKVDLEVMIDAGQEQISDALFMTENRIEEIMNAAVGGSSVEMIKEMSAQCKHQNELAAVCYILGRLDALESIEIIIRNKQ